MKQITDKQFEQLDRKFEINKRNIAKLYDKITELQSKNMYIINQERGIYEFDINYKNFKL